MITRTTHRAVSDRSLAGLQANLGRLSDLQQQLSSGKLISKPSDSPTGTVSALQLRSEIRGNEQWGRAAEDGLGWLGMIDDALTQTSSQLVRAQELTLSGMGTNVPQQARDALAGEVEQLRESLLMVANTSYLGRPVFGGTTAGARAYDAAGTYVGDGGAVVRTVGSGADIRVDTAGPAAFGSGATDVFAILGSIAEGLRTDPARLSTDLERLQGAMANVTGKLSDVGARYGRVEAMREAADERILTLRTSLGDVEDIDLPATIVDLQLQEVAYKAALGATQRVIQPSLVDFLR